MTKRTAARACHECVKPAAIGVAIRTMAMMKISPRRPNRLFSGSETALIRQYCVYITSGGGNNVRQTPIKAAEM